MLKIIEIINILNLKVLAGHSYLERTIEGGYACDLLSWVMAHGKSSCVWITVQTHMNVIAVASLLDISCIIIPENIEVNNETLKKAEDEKIPVLVSEKSAYELCGILYHLGVKEVKNE